MLNLWITRARAVNVMNSLEVTFSGLWRLFDVRCLFTGNVRISDLGLAVELPDGQDKTKGYAGTPGDFQLQTPNFIRVLCYHIENRNHFGHNSKEGDLI